MADIQERSPEKKAALLASQTRDWMGKEIAQGLLRVPEGYDFQTEIVTALGRISEAKDKNGRPAVECCTSESIMSSLRNMALMGLSMARQQCYPIVYGNQLSIQRSYFGDIAVLERLRPDLSISAGVVREGEKYEIRANERNEREIRVTETSLEALDSPIIAAYCTLTEKESGKVVYSEVMTRRQLEVSWSHAKTQNVIKEYPDQMAKRTVIRRAVKQFLYAASAGVSADVAKAYQETTEAEFEDSPVPEPERREATSAERAQRSSVRSKSRGIEGLAESEDLLAREKNEKPEPDQEPGEEDGEDGEEAYLDEIWGLSEEERK